MAKTIQPLLAIVWYSQILVMEGSSWSLWPKESYILFLHESLASVLGWENEGEGKKEVAENT